MENKKEMTAPNVSVGADTEQSIQKSTDISINDNDENIKCFEEMQQGNRMKKSGEFVENNISQEAIVKRASETLSFQAEFNRGK